MIAGTDVTAAIRRAEIDRLVPVVARHPEVRKLMRDRQRELAEDGDVVIEGRDIGTVVAPNAAVKIYLKADPQYARGRRLAERPEIGADALATDLRMRDESDAARMQPAEDAELIDTTDARPSTRSSTTSSASSASAHRPSVSWPTSSPAPSPSSASRTSASRRSSTG